MTEPKQTIQDDIDPARVIAALNELGWPDDRGEQGSPDVPPEAHYRLAEDVIRAADRAASAGSLADAYAAKRIAAEAANRFRDVLCEVLGHLNENPGDDVLVAEIRAHFGKSGPEPTAWRDRCAGYLAVIDQINADRR